MNRSVIRTSVYIIASSILAASSPAQKAAETDPTLTSWLLNTTGATGRSEIPRIHEKVSKIPADVERVRYTDTDVYIESASIPSHNVGPFNDRNPALPADANIL